MASTISPNMNLVIPGVGTEAGPTWATDLNADLGILDQHDHSSGQGVPITPSGLNISADLPFNGNNITHLNTVRFNNLSGTLAGSAPNLGCIYEAGGELVYNDAAGNIVPITNNGNVNAGAGSITGLPSGTASATYSAGTFVWRSATNTPANMDGGSFIFRNIVASSKGLTLNPPNSMAADYSLTLPSIPASTSVLGVDTSGNIGAVASLVAATGANNIANSRTRTIGTSVAAGGVAVSASSGAFSNGLATFVDVTNLSVTIATTGRPVELKLIGNDQISTVLYTSAFSSDGGGVYFAF